MLRCVEGRFADWMDSSTEGSSTQCTIDAPSLGPSTKTCQRSDGPEVMFDSPGAVPQLPTARGKRHKPSHSRIRRFNCGPFPKIPQPGPSILRGRWATPGIAEVARDY